VNYGESEYGDVPTSQLPEPTGYRMLVAPLKVDEKTEGGIYLPEERQAKEAVASVVACVLKQGTDCYTDLKKFPGGPWCKEGDWVILPSYAGTHILVQGMSFRIINDDTVHAVIDDPRGVTRA
jgi:chaperonin GroES